MSKLKDLLADARAVIDGEMNCHTPEYRALDLLWQAMEILVHPPSTDVIDHGAAEQAEIIDDDGSYAEYSEIKARHQEMIARNRGDE